MSMVDVSIVLAAMLGRWLDERARRRQARSVLVTIAADITALAAAVEQLRQATDDARRSLALFAYGQNVVDRSEKFTIITGTD